MMCCSYVHLSLSVYRIVVIYGKLKQITGLHCQIKIENTLTCCTYDTITAHPVSVASFASDALAISSTSFMLSGLGLEDTDGFEGAVDPTVEGSGDKPAKP